MGETYAFKCNACGYRADVSGGRDCGFVAVVQTMTCHNCNELVDVVIGAYGEDGKTADAEMNLDMGICPKCKDSNVAQWDKRKSCPKCDGKMIKGKMSMLWD